MRPKIVAFDALTILATFGATTLLFVGDDPLFGGPGYRDPMSIIGILAALIVLTVLMPAGATAPHPIQPTAPGGAS